MASEGNYDTLPNDRPADDLGDLFDYSADLPDAFQDTSEGPITNGNRTSGAADASGLGLGLDEEVKVPRKRKPVAKLDENR